MMRVSVMADKSFLVNAIGTLLANEIGPAVFTYCWTRNIYTSVGNHPAVVIRVDEGEPENELIATALPKRVDGPLLVMGMSLRSRNIHVVECHQLPDISMEQVVSLVRNFCRIYPKVMGRASCLME